LGAKQQGVPAVRSNGRAPEPPPGAGAAKEEDRCEGRLLAEGVRTRAARFQSDGDVLGELNFGASGSRYGFDIGLSEEVTESVLTGFLEAEGGAVPRSTRLIGLAAGEDAARATLEGDGGGEDR
jgi:hypothetical protein